MVMVNSIAISSNWSHFSFTSPVRVPWADMQAIEMWLVLHIAFYVLKLLSVERYPGHLRFPVLSWCSWKTEGQSKECVVSPTFCSSHCSHDLDTMDFPPVQNDIMNDMPLLGPWMYPNYLILVDYPEECFGGSEVILSIYVQNQWPIAVHLSYTMRIHHPFPALIFPAKSGIEVTEQDELITTRSWLY